MKKTMHRPRPHLRPPAPTTGCSKAQPLLAHAILGALHALLLAPEDSHSGSIAAHILSNGVLEMYHTAQAIPRAKDSLSMITQLVAGALQHVSSRGQQALCSVG